MTKEEILEGIPQFCGLWSVGGHVVHALISTTKCRDEWLLDGFRSSVEGYRETLRRLVDELEIKMPDDPDLDFWRAALRFWNAVAEYESEVVS